MYRLRPINPPTDFERIVAINNVDDPLPITVELMQRWENDRPEGQIRQWHVAVDAEDRVVGGANILHDPWERPGRFWLRLLVDPDHRNRGVGSLLWNDAFAWAQEHGLTQIKTGVRDDCATCLQFAEHRGFKVDRHIFDSKLDLRTFDESPWAGTIEAAEASGIRFISLDQVEITEEVQRKLYDLNCRSLSDVPGWDNALAPFEQFQNWVFKAHWYRPDGQIIATDGDRWVGLASLGHYKETNSVVNQLTGVDREYRGRKLALALKLLGNRRAKEWGADYILTNNDSQNAPMLAINRKLGYKPEPGRYFIKWEALRH
jgi:GNAT superfamily N-acetyltransferase